MKPPPFAYAAPETLDECVALLAEHSDDAKILAGGQSLMPLLNLRMVRPAVIIDIRRVRGLDCWERDGNFVRIGAFVRQRVLETDKNLAMALPLLAKAVNLIGHPATRSRGTIVGSMCHADPAAELPICALLLGGEFMLRSHRGSRVLSADDFFEDALSTAVGPDEMVEAVQIPVASPGSGCAFDEVARRHGDFALVSAGAVVEEGKGRVALGGVGARPILFRYDDILPGAPIDAENIVSFGRQVAGLIEPNSDLHATADYRRSVASVLIERTLQSALAQATSRSGA